MDKNPDSEKIDMLRAKAVDAWERAADQDDVELRDTWEGIAESYRHVAEHLERAWLLQQSAW